MEKTAQDEAGQSVLRARGVVHRKAGLKPLANSSQAVFKERPQLSVSV